MKKIFSRKGDFKSRSLELKKPNNYIALREGRETRRATDTTEKVQDDRDEEEDDDGQTARSKKKKKKRESCFWTKDRFVWRREISFFFNFDR